MNGHRNIVSVKAASRWLNYFNRNHKQHQLRFPNALMFFFNFPIQLVPHFGFHLGHKCIPNLSQIQSRGFSKLHIHTCHNTPISLYIHSGLPPVLNSSQGTAT